MTRTSARPSKAAPLQDGPLSAAQRADARVWMQAARAWTIERHPYLDTALTSMLLVEREGLGTVAVDARWRLYYDPRRTLDLVGVHGIEALASDWVHEVMHLLRDHPERWDALHEPPRQQLIFNVAGDALVNTDVADLGLLILDTDVLFERLPDEAGCTREMTTEEIYRRLLPHVTVTEHDCGSGSGGERRDWEDALSDGIDDGSPDADRGDIIREETARDIRGQKDRGSVPGSMLQWAHAVLEPSVDWRAELRSVVSRRLGHAAGVTDYSFTRQSRRRVPGYTMPGMVGPAPPRVAAVVDTSGSMTRDELEQCLGDLIGLSRAVAGGSATLSVVMCDAQVHSISQIRSPRQVDDLVVRGGGGTDMGAGLDACAELRPRPEVVVVLTDGETAWPPTPPAGLGSARVIALLTMASSADYVPDWMTTIVIDPALPPAPGTRRQPAPQRRDPTQAR